MQSLIMRVLSCESNESREMSVSMCIYLYMYICLRVYFYAWLEMNDASDSVEIISRRFADNVR